MKKEAGFSLIELSVGIAIASIIIGMGVHCIFSWLPDYRLKIAAHDLYANLQWAKVNAIKSNASWSVIFDDIHRQYFVCSDKGIERIVNLSKYGCNLNFGHGNATTGIDGASIDGNDISYNDNSAIFDGRGFCNAGHVYFQNDNNCCYGIGSKPTGFVFLRKLAHSS
ncbi:MAG: Tfp pilus assembly protein FimT/FimU [bacterium]